MVFEEVFSRRQIEERRAADAGPAASAVQARLDAPAPGGARTLRLHVLASGSRGNAAVVEDASTGAGVLVDCGICKRDFLARCDEAGFDPARLAAILVTHDHTDHTKGLGVVLRGLAKKGIEPAVYAEDAVRAASSEVRALEDAHDVRSLHAGDALSLAGMAVHVFRTSHDAAASCEVRNTCTAMPASESASPACRDRTSCASSSARTSLLAARTASSAYTAGSMPFFARPRSTTPRPFVWSVWSCVTRMAASLAGSKPASSQRARKSRLQMPQSTSTPAPVDASSTTAALPRLPLASTCRRSVRAPPGAGASSRACTADAAGPASAARRSSICRRENTSSKTMSTPALASLRLILDAQTPGRRPPAHPLPGALPPTPSRRLYPKRIPPARGRCKPHRLAGYRPRTVAGGVCAPDCWLLRLPWPYEKSRPEPHSTARIRKGTACPSTLFPRSLHART